MSSTLLELKLLPGLRDLLLICLNPQVSLHSPIPFTASIIYLGWIIDKLRRVFEADDNVQPLPELVRAILFERIYESPTAANDKAKSSRLL